MPQAGLASPHMTEWRRRLIGARSSGLDVAEEGFDLTSHGLGLPGQLAGCLEDLMGCGAGIAGGLLNAGNVGGDFTGAESRLLHVARNLLRRRALFFHSAGNRGGDLIYFVDRRSDPLDRAHRFAG